MNIFLGKHEWPNQTQEKTENLIILLSITKTKMVFAYGGDWGCGEVWGWKLTRRWSKITFWEQRKFGFFKKSWLLCQTWLIINIRSVHFTEYNITVIWGEETSNYSSSWHLEPLHQIPKRKASHWDCFELLYLLNLRRITMFIIIAQFEGSLFSLQSFPTCFVYIVADLMGFFPNVLLLL